MEMDSRPERLALECHKLLDEIEALAQKRLTANSSHRIYELANTLVNGRFYYLSIMDKYGATSASNLHFRELYIAGMAFLHSCTSQGYKELLEAVPGFVRKARRSLDEGLTLFDPPIPFVRRTK